MRPPARHASSQSRVGVEGLVCFMSDSDRTRERAGEGEDLEGQRRPRCRFAEVSELKQSVPLLSLSLDLSLPYFVCSLSLVGDADGDHAQSPFSSSLPFDNGRLLSAARDRSTQSIRFILYDVKNGEGFHVSLSRVQLPRSCPLLGKERGRQRGVSRQTGCSSPCRLRQLHLPLLA